MNSKHESIGSLYRLSAIEEQRVRLQTGWRPVAETAIRFTAFSGLLANPLVELMREELENGKSHGLFVPTLRLRHFNTLAAGVGVPYVIAFDEGSSVMTPIEQRTSVARIVDRTNDTLPSVGVSGQINGDIDMTAQPLLDKKSHMYEQL